MKCLILMTVMFRSLGKSLNREEKRVIVNFWNLSGLWNKKKWRGREKK